MYFIVSENCERIFACSHKNYLRFLVLKIAICLCGGSLCPIAPPSSRSSPVDYCLRVCPFLQKTLKNLALRETKEKKKMLRWEKSATSRANVCVLMELPHFVAASQTVGNYSALSCPETMCSVREKWSERQKKSRWECESRSLRHTTITPADRPSLRTSRCQWNARSLSFFLYFICTRARTFNAQQKPCSM